MLSDCSKDMQREPSRMRVVDCDELHGAVHELRQERHVAAQPVQLGDYQRRTCQPTLFERGLQLRPIAQLAAFYLGVFANQFPAPAIEVGPHRMLLRF
jgi:hypothetical protein